MWSTCTRRRHGFLALIVGAILAGLIAWPAPSAHACDFEAPPPPEEALEEADAVFSGEVESIEDAGDRNLAVTFEVDQVWKGTGDATVSVHTEPSEAECGFEFEEDESYLVYAHERSSGLGTSLYHRTSELDRADEDLEALGQGAAPVPDDGGETEEPEGSEVEDSGDGALHTWLGTARDALDDVVQLAMRLLRL